MPADPSRAVFLSYASQDADAALRLCSGLRDAGVEVWFDQSELRGGDAWDAKIRKQIRECALFVPLISARTQARREGYFRLEWRLAAQRTHMMSDQVAFLLPVVIDATPDAEADVPLEFKAVQWTRLPAADRNAAFAARVKALLESAVNGETQPPSAKAGQTEARGEGGVASARSGGRGPRRSFRALIALGVTVVGLAAAWAWWRPVQAGRLVAKAWEQMDKTEMARNELLLAEGYCRQAVTLDETNPAVWAAWSAMNTWYLFHEFELLPARREAARDYAQKALALDPKSYEARYAWAHFVARLAPNRGDERPALPILRELLQERPDEPRALYALGYALAADAASADESFALLERLAEKHPWFAGRALDEVGWMAFFQGRFALAESAAERALKAQPYWNNLGLKATLALRLRGDVELAQATIDRLPPSALQENWGISLAVMVADWRGDYNRAVSLLQGVSRDWLENFFYHGPTSFETGRMRLKAKQVTAAEKDFRRALELIAARLDKTPNDAALLYYKAEALRLLGMRAEADQTYRQVKEIYPATFARINFEPPERALDYVREMIDRGYTIDYFPAAWWFTANSLRRDPMLENVRRAPGFDALLKEVEARERQRWAQSTASAGAKSTTALPEKTSAVPVRPEDRPAAPEKSLVVLPLENLSPDPENAFFTDGMHAELISTLQRTTELRVFGRDSALAFKRGEMTVAEFARRVGAANVLSGSVRRTNTKARILLELRRANDDAVLWSYAPNTERDLSDTFAVQSEIAEQVARALQARESVGSNAHARYLTRNPRAFDLLMKGQQRFFSGDQRGFEEAIQLFGEAFELDPDYVVPAYMRAHANSNLFHWETDPAARVRRAEEARRWVEITTRLDPNGFGPIAAANYLINVEDDNLRGLEQVEKGRRALPNDTASPTFHGGALERLGRVAEALESYRQATRIDPVLLFSLLNETRALSLLRREAETFAMLDRIEAMFGRERMRDLSLLRIAEVRYRLRGDTIDVVASPREHALWCWRTQRWAEAAQAAAEAAAAATNDVARFEGRVLQHDALVRLHRSTDANAIGCELLELARKLQSVPEVGPPRHAGWLARAAARAGRTDEAIAAGRRFVEDASQERQPMERWRREAVLAEVYAYLQRPRECCEVLARLLRLPCGLTVPMLKVDPAWDNLRADPAFQALLVDPKNNAPL